MRRGTLITSFVQGARSAWCGLLDVAYPPRCLGCQARTRAGDGPLCPRCIHRMERPDPDEVRDRLAGLSLPQRALDGGFALWIFDKGGTLQQVQHALKYGNRPRYGLSLGRLIGRAYRQAFAADALPDGVLPIPLHRARLYERGYNQSALLAQGVAGALGAPLEADLLCRPRRTRSQTALSRAARWQNVHGAFQVARPGAAAGRRLLLIDDVLTTGATAEAAAQALKAAGARQVSLATLALARS